MKLRLANRVLVELAAQAAFLALTLAAVFAFAFPGTEQVPRGLFAAILAIVMAAPAAYGGWLILRALHRSR